MSGERVTKTDRTVTPAPQMALKLVLDRGFVWHRVKEVLSEREGGQAMSGIVFCAKWQKISNFGHREFQIPELTMVTVNSGKRKNNGR
jgi:hypothetical protein